MPEWVEVTGFEMVKEMGNRPPCGLRGQRGGAKAQEPESLKENDWLAEDGRAEGSVGHGPFPTLAPRSLPGIYSPVCRT